MIYCEAASGVYDSADLVSEFALPARRAVLTRLGFSSSDVEDGNFALDLPYRGADAAYPSDSARRSILPEGRRGNAGTMTMVRGTL